MTETVEVTATKAAFVQAANGHSNVMVATNGRTPVKVHVTAAVPVPGADDPAVEIDKDNPLSLSNLTGSDKVYVRGAVEDTTVIVIRG